MTAKAQPAPRIQMIRYDIPAVTRKIKYIEKYAVARQTRTEVTIANTAELLSLMTGRPFCMLFFALRARDKSDVS